MDESRPDNNLSEAERRHDRVRGWILDALTMTTTIAAGLYYRPDGIVAALITGAGAAVVGMIAWRMLWAMSGLLLGVLSMLIYLFTIMHALNFGLPAIVLAMFAPGIAQAYVIGAMWVATGTPFQPLTLMCLAWLAVLGIWIFEQNLLTGRCARHWAGRKTI